MRNPNNTFVKALTELKIKTSWSFKADRVVKMSKIYWQQSVSPTCSLIPSNIEYLE